VVLQALLVKDVPATREVLAILPNVFSVLCLNTRGLEDFVECNPFNRLFKVLLSADYQPADLLVNTATNLGNATDELMRHQQLEEVRGVVVVVMAVVTIVTMVAVVAVTVTPPPRCAPSPGPEKQPVLLVDYVTLYNGRM
jgi:E3 ubiquitin-protein ligase HUWE1